MLKDIVKTRFDSKNKMIIKKSKIGKIFRGSLFFISLTLISSLTFYTTVIEPKVLSAEKIIQYNNQHIQSISPDKNYKEVLFSTPYTDNDFKDDLMLFAMIYDEAIKDPDQKFRIIESKDNFRYFRTYMMMKMLNNNYSYSYYLNKNNVNKQERDKVMTLEKLSLQTKRLQKKKKELLNVTGGREVEVIYSIFGSFKMFNASYDSLEYAFKKEYGENSYLDSFTRKPFVEIDGHESEDEKQYWDKRFIRNKEIRKNIIQAYENKDYDKLRLYFKQNREFLNYIVKFKIGEVSYSYFNKHERRLDIDNVTNLVFYSLLFKQTYFNNKDIKNIDERQNKVLDDLALY